MGLIFMTTMKDVAKLAKVSDATVSRVFSDPDAVSDKTKQKVLEAAEELNYELNVLARNLRKMKTEVIMVILPDISNPFFSKIVRGIESVAMENNYKILLGDTKNDVDLEKEYLRNLDQKYADGVITLTARTDPALIEEISKRHNIVLACEYFDKNIIPTVSIDNVEGAYKATNHLIRMGHKRIAHISGPEDVILTQDRLKGYKKALKANNLKYYKKLIKEGDFSYQSGFENMSELIKMDNPPTAVFCDSDQMAIGAIKAIRNHGFNVPDDYAVVGFDNIEIASIFEPGLTTISQPMYEIGVNAMRLLLDIMNGREIKKNRITLENELIIRESCGYKRQLLN
jgi:LacI family repressor for deo operon, udp, cdd, tsx, nupC, and nupG